MWNVCFSIREGMAHLTRQFDQDRDQLPWFEIRLEENRGGYMFHYPGLDIAHAPGRCLDALLYGESVIGDAVDEDVLATFKKWLLVSMDAADGLIGENIDGRRVVEFHHFREGLLALNALVRYRRDSQALEMGTAFVQLLDDLMGADGRWDFEKISARGVYADSDFPALHEGRLVYALLQWYQTTGQAVALKTAGRIVPYTLRTVFDEQGNLTAQASIHVHSITSSFSGAADYYRMIGDREGMQRLIPILYNGILPLASRSGWVKELLSAEFSHVGGETNSTGDIIQACLCMAATLHDDTYYAIAERMLRGHLLPAQVFPQDIPPEWRLENTGKGDQYADIALRMRGGFGFPFPNDRAPRHYDNSYCRITTLDITAGSVQALCRCVTEGVTEIENAFSVNLLVDAVRDGFLLRQTALDTWTVESLRPVSMRLPTNHGVTVDGEAKSVEGRLSLAAGRHTVRLNLPNEWQSETLFGKTFQTQWIGEQAVKMFPCGTVSDMFSRFRDEKAP